MAEVESKSSSGGRLRKLRKPRGSGKPRKSWSSRRTGAVAVVAALLVALGAFQLENLTLLFGGSGYHAEMRHSAGLTPGTEVRVAGVKVGKVTSVDLEGLGTDEPHVGVDFRIDRDVELGDATSATVRLKTVLGQRYLALEPEGEGSLVDDTIPLSRTATPLDVVEAVDQLAETVGEVDSEQLGEALAVLTETFADTPEHVSESLEGLADLSDAVAERDEELGELLESANAVTDVLAERDEEFQQLLSDGNRLLDEVADRKDAISDLLTSTVSLSEQLQGLVEDQEDQLEPALEQLSAVITLLEENQENLEETLSSAGPFIQAFTNVLGNGRWFDSYIDGLLQPYELGVG